MEARHFYLNGQLFEEGALLSVDGATGRIFAGHIPIRASAESSEHIGRLLSWADSTSGARFWTRDIGPADIDVASHHSTAGLGVISLTDLMIDGGAVNSFIAAINDLSQNPDDASVYERISGITRDTCESLLRKLRQTPVTLRLPNLGSPRAQSLIGAWESLETRLFLPLGIERFYVSMLSGIADATTAASYSNLTVLASGLSSAGELTAFRSATESVGLKSPGAMLQSACGLFAAQNMVQPNTALWLDLRELTRSFHGYPSALSFSDNVVADLLADGPGGYNPSAQLWPDLCEPIKRLALCAAKGVQVGVECSEGTALSLIEEMYQLGLRNFSIPIGALAEARLALGQLATKEIAT
jgi:pyruvate,orthophosphate dikinase